MQKIVIVSDTHGNRRLLRKISPLFFENDKVVFLGDGYADMLEYKSVLGDKLVAVKGNCDGGSGFAVFEAEDVKILATHGHEYGAKRGLDRLYYKAKEENADVVLYGHTHAKIIVEKDGVTFINPGTLYRYAESKSYCYLVINGKKVVPTIVEVDD